MEIVLRKERNSLTSEFINFCIREYVAEIRRKDWKKCWPFGSLGNPYKLDEVSASEFLDSRFLTSRNCPRDCDASDGAPEHTEAPNFTLFDADMHYFSRVFATATEVEISNEKKDRSETTTDVIASQTTDDMGKTVNNGFSELSSSKVNSGQCRNEESVNEGAKFGNSDAADDDDETGINQTWRKRQKFLLLSDILRELAGPSCDFHVRFDVTNADKVNSRFVTESEDEWDDVTLGTFFKKQKGIDVNRVLKKKKKKKKKKKRNTIRVEEDSDVGPRSHLRKTRIDDVEIQTVVKRKRLSPPEVILPENKSSPSCPGNEEITLKTQKDSQTVNEDSEMEAVMLLASHFSEAENPSTPGHGAKSGQTVQSTSADFDHGQRSLAVNIWNKNTELVCACVHKKIRASSTPKDPESRSLCMPLKDGVEPPSLGSMVRLARAERTVVAQICSMNRNPADFTIPEAENNFMRGG